MSDLVKELEIQNLDGRAMVSSLAVAKKFGKEHKNVLRDIRELKLRPEFSRLNFEPSNYLDSRGKIQPMVYMTRDGLMILTMGWGDELSMELKQDYILAFNAMDDFIRARLAPMQPTMLEWGTARLEGKRHRLSLTDAIKYILIPAAIQQGSHNSDKFYISYSKMLNKEFIDDPDFEPPRGFNRRNYLSAWDLTFMGELEKGLAKLLVDEVEKGTLYKEIYKIAKAKVIEFVEFFGKRKPELPEKTPVPSLKQPEPSLLLE